MYQPNTTYYQPSYQAPVRQPNQQIPPTQPIAQNVSPFLKGRLVSSIEEARAQTIDFDGSVFYFPDLANHKIYTKQINLDGTSTLNMYELKELPIPNVVQNGDFITREEFDNAMKQIHAALHPEAATQPKPTGQTQVAAESYNF